jgi:hypothetical protein
MRKLLDFPSRQARASQVREAVSVIFHYLKGSVGRDKIVIKIRPDSYCVVTRCNIGVGTP